MKEREREKVARKRMFDGLEKEKGKKKKKKKEKQKCILLAMKRGILTRINKRGEHMFKVSGKYLH